jgi:hypothetical protein
MIPTLYKHESIQRSCLINGVEYDYDFCGDRKDSYNGYNVDLKYLGKGKVYKIDNKIQSGGKKIHFWAKIKPA